MVHARHEVVSIGARVGVEGGRVVCCGLVVMVVVVVGGAFRRSESTISSTACIRIGLTNSILISIAIGSTISASIPIVGLTSSIPIVIGSTVSISILIGRLTSFNPIVIGFGVATALVHHPREQVAVARVRVLAHGMGVGW